MISTFSFWKQGLGGTIVGGGTNGLWTSANNGVSWTQVPGASSSITFTCICTDSKGNWLAGSVGNGAWYSTDNGATFSVTNVSSGNVAQVTYSAKKWVLAQSGVSVLYSNTSNGPYLSPANVVTLPVNLLTGNSNVIIATVGNTTVAGAIWTSTDGNIWTRQSQPGDLYIDATQTADNKWYFSGDGGGAYGGTHAPVRYTPNFTSYTDLKTNIVGTPVAGVLPNNAVWNSVAFGNGVFVAVAQSNNINSCTSVDSGETWVQAGKLPNNTGTYSSVAYGAGKFVAVASGSSTAALSLNNGATWTAVVMPANTTWCKVKFGNNIFMALGSAGKTATSTDGINWIAGGVTGNLLNYDIAFGNGLWVATGVNTTVCYSSNNGATWTANSVGMPLSTNYRSIEFGNGYFLTMADGNLANLVCAVSTTGTSFTQQSSPAVGTILPYSLVYCAGAFLTSGYDTGQVLYTLNNGTTWTYLNMPSVSYWYGIGYGNGRVVFTGGYTNTTKSAYANIGTPTNGRITSYGNNYIVADGTTNKGIFYPINSTTIGVTNLNSGTFNDISSSGNNFVAAADITGLYYSNGGASWTSGGADFTTYNTVFSIPSASTFIAGSSNSGYWYSTNNGSTWVQSINNSTGNILSID